MPLTENQVRTIASDARIALNETELTILTSDLNQILVNIEVLLEHDLSDVEPTFHPIAGLTNVMRDDVKQPSMGIQAALANAAVHQGGQFKVPPILDDMGGDR